MNPTRCWMRLPTLCAFRRVPEGILRVMPPLFVSAEPEDAMEELTIKHLESAGWTIEELEPAEEVSAPATHDARFADLYRHSKTNGVASIFSPY